MRQLLSGAFLGVALVAACSEPERRPSVEPSRVVSEMRRSAGTGVQDCGEAPEARKETACRVHSVGECLEQALKDCRPAYGTRSYFGPEGDAVRIDWLVLKDGGGGCKLVSVVDKTSDPLSKERGPVVSDCEAIAWKPHDTIANCEAPTPDRCHPRRTEEPGGE